MRLVFYLYILLIGLQCIIVLGRTEFTNRNFLSINSIDFDKVEKLLTQFKLTFVEEVTPSLYIYKYAGKHLSKKQIGDIKVASNGKVINIDVIKQHQIELPDLIYTESKSSTPSPPSYTTPAEKQEKRLPCHGMGIEEVWEAGYNGSGIVVAVCDIGVDVGIQDLEPNIDLTLSHNFVDNNTDVHQDHYHNYVRSLDLTNHGNNCAGLIVAVKRNCTSGFAYGSKIAVLKVATIIEQKWERISDDFIVKALSWHVHEIDVYSCSWQYNKAFVGLDKNQLESISFGTRCGRKKKGSIYVFPAGAIAEGFSNSIYTIAVSSLNPYGGKPEYVETCACTLTSTYGEGTNYGVPYMIYIEPFSSKTHLDALHSVAATRAEVHPLPVQIQSNQRDILRERSQKVRENSYPNVCKNDFKGTSASVAMVSAIVALALQANNNLTWRDVQHLIVAASDHKGHVETLNFKTNAAGHHFHNCFGFGLLNASMLVRLAENSKGVPTQRNITVRSDQCLKADCFQQHKRYEVWKRFVQIYCDETDVCCISKVEHVIATISYKSSNESHLGISITSPGKTVSVLMKDGQSKVKGPYKRVNKQFLSVNFWDESPFGQWELSLRQYKFNNENKNAFNIISFELTITGTSEDNSSHCQIADEAIQDCSRVKNNIPFDTTTMALPTNHEEPNNNLVIIWICAGVVLVFVILLVVQQLTYCKRETTVADTDIVEEPFLHEQSTEDNNKSQTELKRRSPRKKV